MNNLREFVYKYKTKHVEGFTNEELKEVLKKFPNINMEKYNLAMMGNTCMLKDEDVINYHCDVFTALRCGIEGRNQRGYEFD